MKIIDDIMHELVDHHLLGSGSWHPRLSPSLLREILERHLIPHEHVGTAEPLIIYFATEEDREDFLQVLQEAKPNMQSIKL